LLLFGDTIYQNLGVNAWSVDYLHAYDAHFPVALPAPYTHRRAALWLARDALARGEPEQAAAFVETLAENDNQAALVVLGEALADRGDFAAAIDAWSQVGAYYSLYEAAEAARLAGRGADALAAYRAVYQLDMEKGLAPLAGFLWSLGTQADKDEAMALLRDALAHLQDADGALRIAWYQRLGSYLQQLERWDEAEAVYGQALAEDPQAWQAYIGLGWVYYKRGDGLDAALLAFQKVTAIDPARGDGYIATGQVWYQEGQIARAETSFAQALQIDPEQQWWWLSWANMVRESGDLPRAIAMYLELVEKYPDWAHAYYELAWAYQLDGASERAVEAIEQALRLVAPPSEWYFVRTGKIYELAERPLEAMDAYRAALSINPLNASAQQGLQRLEQK
jgi:tetratricopeptide (TPR) repeat protein